MSLLSSHLAHSPPYITPGFTPVHQWERDASNRNTCNYPPTLLSLESDWTARCRSDVLATAHAGSATAATAPSHPPTPRQTLQQPPPTWASCSHAVRRRNAEFKTHVGQQAVTFVQPARWVIPAEDWFVFRLLSWYQSSEQQRFCSGSGAEP